MDSYFYITRIVQRCISEKFNIPLQNVNFNKVLGNPPPNGYGFNQNSLLAFVLIDIVKEIQKKNPSKNIQLNSDQSKILINGTSVPLIAFIAQQF
jgi:hypothetical protein